MVKQFKKHLKKLVSYLAEFMLFALYSLGTVRFGVCMAQYDSAWESWQKREKTVINMKQKTDGFTGEARKEYASDRTDHPHKRKHKYKIGMILFMLLGSTLLLSGCDAVLMNPKGVIASDQKDLLILSTLLMLIVVIPVFILTFVFAWKYRAKNKEAKYTPNWAHSTIL